MGTAITEILIKKEISIKDLQGQILAVDTFNMLYQFISSIRQSDGTPLTDSKGRITSHLIGLFNRVTKLMTEGIKFIFVFDGEVPDLKKAERERRKLAKLEAQAKYDAAKQEENIEEMKKYASRTSKLTSNMVDEAKELIRALGMPIVDAPSEGEAQAAYIVSKGEAYAIVSQDADSLVFGAPIVIKNLTIGGKKKMPGSYVYKNISPETLSLAENLNNLKITNDQLIVLAMLVGTDYNIGGIKGIGPKKALKLLETYKEDYEKIFEEAKWNDNFDFEWKLVYDTIKNVKITDDYDLTFEKIDTEKIIEILVEKHDFSKERVDGTIAKLMKGMQPKTQKGLGDFF